MNNSSGTVEISAKASLYRNLATILTTGKLNPEECNLPSREWKLICRVADENGVAPLLYWKLSQAGWPGGVTDTARSFLQNRFFNSAAINNLLLSQLDEILEKLNQSGIQVTVLKGAHLARWLYPDPAFRPMSDLDLLVRPEDLAGLLQVYKSAGFRFQKATYHILLAGGKREDIVFEVHWSLPGGRPAPAWLWDPALDLAAFHLLYLSAHLAAQHANSPRLIWLYDLHLLLERYGDSIEGEFLKSQANELGWQPALYKAIRMTNLVFGTPIPDWSDDFTSGDVPEITAQTWSRQALKLIPMNLRFQFLVSFLFPSSGYMRRFYQPQPAWVWPVYYPLRWLGLGEKNNREN